MISGTTRFMNGSSTWIVSVWMGLGVNLSRKDDLGPVAHVV